MRQMKDSGIEWIGEVPSDWRNAPLWALSSARAGGTPKSSEPSYWDDDGLPWISIGDMSSVKKVQATSKAVSKTGLNSKNIPVGRQGDVLFAMYASVGAVAMLDIKACWNQAILGLRAKPHQIKNWYLYYLLKGLGDTWELLSNANTQANLNQHSTMHLRVSVPPINQQEEMAHYLDQETSKIDLLIAKKEQLIEKLLERRQALITQVATKGLDPDVPMKNSGVAWLGRISEAWATVPLWVLFNRTKRTGFADERLLSVYRDHGVVPKDSRDDNHNVESADLSNYQLVEIGDLAVNKMKAWQGSISISTIRGIVSPAYFVFSKRQEFLDDRFVHYLLRSNPYIFSYSLISKGVRIGQWDLQPEYFRQLPVLVPPEGEQRNIADYLDQETSKMDELRAKAESAIALLKERRQALVTQVVTGKLDVRGFSDGDS